MRRVHAARIPALLLGLALLLVGCPQPDQRTIVLFHTSDVHGGLTSRPARWHEADPTRRIGGYAALAKLVNAEARPHALLDSGDIFQGTPEGNLTRGKAVIAAMNAVHYAAMVIGNHEFDYGENALRALVAMADFPVLAANIRRKSDGRLVDYAVPTALLDIGGVRVGVVGLATHHTRTSTLPKNVAHLDFDDETQAARAHAQGLRAKGADIVIALTHCGLLPSRAGEVVKAEDVELSPRDLRYVGDLKIARGGDVDIVMGGHMHTGIDGRWRDPESGVWIVQSHHNLVATSRVEITVDVVRDQIVAFRSKLVRLWIDRLGEDPEVVRVIDGWADRVRGELDRRIGECADDRMTRSSKLDHPLGSWVADAMRATVDADIGIQNSFGIRADLFQGAIRLRDIYAVMPFENTIVTLDLPGKAIEKLVRENLKGDRSMIQVSGLQIVYTPTADGPPESLTIWVNGTPVEAERMYKVATNNYLAGGGAGGEAFEGHFQHDTGRPIRELLIEILERDSPLHAPPTGRIRQAD